MKERQGHTEDLYSHLTISFINCLRSDLIPLVLFELLPPWGRRLFLFVLWHAQGYSEMSPDKRKKKKSPLKFKLWHFFESCKEMMILYLKLSDASSKIPHCYVMYYHSNLSLHWYSTPYGQAVLCQRCCFSDDAKNTENLNSKSLKQCFPSDHTESQKEWIPKLWQGKGGNSERSLQHLM